MRDVVGVNGPACASVDFHEDDIDSVVAERESCCDHGQRLPLEEQTECVVQRTVLALTNGIDVSHVCKEVPSESGSDGAAATCQIPLVGVLWITRKLDAYRVNQGSRRSHGMSG